MEELVLQPKTHDCCQDVQNLEERDSGRSDLVLRVCRACQARHFEVSLDPIDLRMEME